jgi:predicted O-methyltransferase YrrM
MLSVRGTVRVGVMNVEDEIDLRQNRDCGQLWLDDRKMLWTTVRELKPEIAVESGTWRGGGSTFFIASAMHRNGFGVLHTFECNAAMHAEAKMRYEGPWRHLRPHVRLHHGDSVLMIPRVFEQLKHPRIDFVFIDGGEDAVKGEFMILWPRLRVGGVLCSHDYYNGKKIPELEEMARGTDPEARTVIIGTGGGNFEAGSVGFAKAVKLR